MNEATTGLQRVISYHTASYYNTLVQLVVGVLAVIWFTRSLFTHGVVHTARAAAIKAT